MTDNIIILENVVDFDPITNEYERVVQAGTPRFL